ncbi:GFA family protein [Vreelandella sp. EE7]
MLKHVGGVAIQPKHKATCHCGKIELELDLPEGLVEPKRCNCSICARRGAVMAYVPLDGLRIVKGTEHLTLYQFNTRVAKHYFCSTCGIYTHHQSRSHPDRYGFNVACLEGVNPFELENVPVDDGIHHELDR